MNYENKTTQKESTKKKLHQVEEVSQLIRLSYENFKKCIKNNENCKNKKCLKDYKKEFNESLITGSLNLNKYFFLKNFFKKNENCHVHECRLHAENLFQRAKNGFKLLESPIYQKVLLAALRKVKNHAAFNKFKENFTNTKSSNTQNPLAQAFCDENSLSLEETLTLKDLIQEGFLGLVNAFLKFDFTKQKLDSDEKTYEYFLNYLRKFAYKYMLVYVLKNVSIFSLSQSTFQKLVSQKQAHKYEHVFSLESLISENKEKDDETQLKLENKKVLETSHPATENLIIQKETSSLANFFLKKALSQLSPKDEFLVRAKLENVPLSQKEKKRQKLALNKLKKTLQRIEQVRSLLA